VIGIPASFVFTDVAKANAEIARLYRAVALSGAAISEIIRRVPDDALDIINPIVAEMTEQLEALSDERESGN
jgi:hypothetical protein